MPPLPVTSGMSMAVQRPVLPTPTPRPRQTRKTKDPVVTTGHITFLPPCPPKILTPMLMGTARHRTFHCTGHCPLGGGSVPCLQCVKCLCLFHPECTCMPPQTVTIIQAGAARFLCPNCYRENKENVGSNKWIPPDPYEPLAHDPSSSSSSSGSDTDSEDEGGGGGGQKSNGVWVENYAKVCLRPDTPPTPPSSPSPSHSLGPWKVDMSDLGQELACDQTQQASGSREGITKTLSILPPSSTSIGNQLVQIPQQGAVPACFLLVQGGAGAPGGELVSMPGTGPGPMGMSKGMPPLILPRLSMQQQQQMQMASPVMIQQPQFQSSAAMSLQMPLQGSLQQRHGKPVGKHYKQYYEAIIQRENSFLGELSQRYLLLRHIFKYLSVRDLLMASQVCLLWRDLALSPSLWETVRLRNVCVKDWGEFARFLEQRNTKNIDLRKMRLREKLEGTKKTMQNVTGKKIISKRKSSAVQESSTSFQPICKPSDQAASSQGRKTSSLIQENLERIQGEGENQEACRRKETLLQGITEAMPHSSRGQDKQTKGGNKSLAIQKEAMETCDKRKKGNRGKEEPERKEEVKMEVEEAKDGGVKDANGGQSSEDLYMEYEEGVDDRPTSAGDPGFNEAPARKREAEEAEWQEMLTALSSVKCLRGVTLPACPGHTLQLLLASCRHLTSINAMDLRHPSGPVRFDPAYLMETPDLTELRIGSASGFSLTANFNFIKLQKLRVLVMRGLTGDTWPYLGTNLTTLQVGPIRTFTASTWANLGNMTNLQALWLEEGGTMFDSNIYDGLSRLTKLRRLCLFNFVVGPKLGQALKKLPNLDRLFVLPVATDEASIKTQNGNVLAAMETLRHVEELVWAVHATDVHVSGGCDHIHLCPTKAKLLPGMTGNSETSLWSLAQLEKVLKRHLPHSRMRIIKLDPTAASHLSLATL